MATVTLTVMRHADVVWPPDSQGQPLCYGATDLPAQAEATRRAALAWAAHFMPDDWRQARCYASGLQRTHQLVHAVHDVLQAAHPDGPPLPTVCVDARLNEFDFGRWEGVPWAAIPQWAVDEWVADFADHPFGGHETVRQMLERVRAALADAVRAAHEAGHTRVYWFAHAGTARAVHWTAHHPSGKAPLAAEWPVLDVPPGGMAHFTLDPRVFTG